MLTARDGLNDKAVGFESGADDYLVKPFSLPELDMRLRALIRRGAGRHGIDRTLRFGEMVFDPDMQSVIRGGTPITLTRTGYILLRVLMEAAPRIVPRATLEQAVWGEDLPDSDSLRTHIHALCQAVDKPFAHLMIVTVTGMGFRMVLPGT